MLTNLKVGNKGRGGILSKDGRAVPLQDSHVGVIQASERWQGGALARTHQPKRQAIHPRL